MMPQVIAHGELLIDFVPTVSGVTLAEAPAFIKAPGGAPANVAVGLAKLGISSGFMGQVGDDAFGHFLAQTLQQYNVDVATLEFSGEARTALAFVSLKADGERDFMFYRHPSADMRYRPEQVNATAIRQARIFHHGSISLIEEPARAATLHALQIAQEAGVLVSYDPNLRLPLWPSKAAAREGILSVWQQANLIKVSEEELAFLTSEQDLLRGAEKLFHPRLQLLLVTCGSEGCCYFTPAFNGKVESFHVNAVDTTGAGDGFTAGMLSCFVHEPNLLKEEHLLRAACRFANAVGALTTTQRGAIPALPALQTVQDFLREND